MHCLLRVLDVSRSCLIILLLASPAIAQTRLIKGKVTDDKGQPVIGASIVVRGADSKTQGCTTKTDKKGTYICIGLPSGNFYVVARAEGFAPSHGTASPKTAEETVIDLSLKPGVDVKLWFEMTPQELEKLKSDMAKAEKRKQLSGEVQAIFDSGRRLAEQEKHLEAIEEFKKALAKDPEQANIIGYMAESYSKLNKDGEALELYQKAVAIEPNDAALYTNMGVLLTKMGKNAESEEAFKKALALNPGGSAKSFFNIGATMFNSGRVTEAAEAFKKAIEADATYADAYYQLGMCLSGNPDTMAEAIRVLKKYLEIGKQADQLEVSKQLIATLEETMKKK